MKTNAASVVVVLHRRCCMTRFSSYAEADDDHNSSYPTSMITSGASADAKRICFYLFALTAMESRAVLYLVNFWWFPCGVRKKKFWPRFFREMEAFNSRSNFPKLAFGPLDVSSSTASFFVVLSCLLINMQLIANFINRTEPLYCFDHSFSYMRRESERRRGYYVKERRIWARKADFAFRS